MSMHTALRHLHSDGDMLDARVGGIQGILGRILDPEQDGANGLVGTLVAHDLKFLKSGKVDLALR